MNEQKVASERVLEELKKDLLVKGSKRKKIDHWKPFACEAVGVKKMGDARWQMILEYGYKNELFEVENVNGKDTLKPFGEAQKQAEILDLGEEEGEEEVVISRAPAPRKQEVRARPIQTNAHRSDLIPQKGDILWAIRPDNSVFRGEIDEVDIGAHVTPLDSKDGYWSYVTSNDLFEDEREAKKEASSRASKRSSSVYWSRDAMGKQELADFLEYMTHKDEFLKWLKDKKEDEDLLSDL